MSKTVLITGGFGYVGGRVAAELAKLENWKIRLGTRRQDRTPPTWLKEAEVLPLDLDDAATIQRAVEGVDYVVHLAALNEIDSARHPEQALLVNGLGSLKLLNAAIQAKVGRFLYFSTAHVYGAPLKGTLDESCLARPIHPYAITHRTAEDFVLAAHAQGQIEGLVVRLSNGYGAPTHPDVDRWTLIANDLCRQAVTTGQLVLKSPGLQRRDFVTLEDVGRAAAHLLTMDRGHCQDGLFNLGGACTMSIREMTDLIARRCEAVLGFAPEIVAPSPTERDVADALDFRIDKLRSTGFELTGDATREIDALLTLCQNAFGGAVLR
ncbi:MAG TPA: SDR family oxidoreductase [Stenomitos sp.]